MTLTTDYEGLVRARDKQLRTIHKHVHIYTSYDVQPVKTSGYTPSHNYLFNGETYEDAA